MAYHVRIKHGSLGEIAEERLRDRVREVGGTLILTHDTGSLGLPLGRNEFEFKGNWYHAEDGLMMSAFTRELKEDAKEFNELNKDMGRELNVVWDT